MNIYIQCNKDEDEYFNVCAYSITKNTSKSIKILKLVPEILQESKLLVRQQPELAKYFIPHIQNYKGLGVFLSCYNRIYTDIYDLVDTINWYQYSLGFVEEDQNQSFVVFNCEEYHNLNKLYPNMINSQNFSRRSKYFWIPEDKKYRYSANSVIDGIVYKTEKDKEFYDLLKESHEKTSLFGLVKTTRKIDYIEVNRETIPEIKVNECNCSKKA